MLPIKSTNYALPEIAYQTDHPQDKNVMVPPSIRIPSHWVSGRISLLLEGCHPSSCWPKSLCISRLVGPLPAGSHLDILLAQSDVCIPSTQTKSQSEGVVWLTRWPALHRVLKTGIREINSRPSLSSCNICPFSLPGENSSQAGFHAGY